MNLSDQFSNLHDSIRTTIASLIELYGIECEFSNHNKVLDLRMFTLDSSSDSPYRLEILGPGSYPILFIGENVAYDERGQQCSHSDVTATHLEELCEALDCLERFGPMRWNVVLRATVSVGEEELPENFEFPDIWEGTDHTPGNGEDVDAIFRLDTVVTVTAPTAALARKEALNEPPSLGLDDILCEVTHWIDEDLADDTSLCEFEAQ